ncbi:MBL fold metallo-hydrolase [Nocardioides sp. Kera G14]|uniref:MBL fold metallo-hydrolase n=1 Tax=Nocardioides sp. Kera G14 TaxID=2884264 RepID=UPI001D120990|nr:MBL fold metallo-hydrolase [Nocardioides sp. Kera G14]UDY22782.1 MBL fold metallo-hydrolase [Nocardioides sp. Kera G14]
MKLTIVGCAGSYPGPESPASSYLLEAEAPDPKLGGVMRIWRILLDMGNGSLGALHNYTDPLAMDAVFLSHLHADHCLDMTSYYVLRKYHPSGQQPRIPVYGPKGTGWRLARAYDLPRTPGMREEFKFNRHHHGEPVRIGPFALTPYEVDHPVPAYGFRIECEGKVLAYTGDTGPTDTLLDVAVEADLLLAEASFREVDENPPGLHLTGREAGEVAAKARVGQLVLTHIPAWHEREGMLAEARAVFDGPIDLADAGAVYTF